MNILLWTLQIVLAVLFGFDGYEKFFRPQVFRIQGLSDAGLVLFIGASEMAGATGLVLPMVIRFLTWMTPLAALGIAMIMTLAARFHLKRHESLRVGYTCFLLGVSLFVAIGRWTFVPEG